MFKSCIVPLERRGSAMFNLFYKNKDKQLQTAKYRIPSTTRVVPPNLRHEVPSAITSLNMKVVPNENQYCVVDVYNTHHQCIQYAAELNHRITVDMIGDVQDNINISKVDRYIYDHVLDTCTNIDCLSDGYETYDFILSSIHQLLLDYIDAQDVAVARILVSNDIALQIHSNQPLGIIVDGSSPSLFGIPMVVSNCLPLGTVLIVPDQHHSPYVISEQTERCICPKTFMTNTRIMYRMGVVSEICNYTALRFKADK